MLIKPIKTKIFDPNYQNSLEDIVDYIHDLPTQSTVAITSKIIAICQKRFVSKQINKDDLIKQEADEILYKNKQYNITITIKNKVLIASAGIDESNSDQYYILWPNDPFMVAQQIWNMLKNKFQHNEFGVIITDSHTTPMRKGVTGICIGFYGIKPLKNYIDQNDLFKRKMQITQANIVDGLAAAAVLAMGECDEQTPICLLTDITFAKFAHTTQADIDSIHIDKNQDIYFGK